MLDALRVDCRERGDADLRLRGFDRRGGECHCCTRGVYLNVRTAINRPAMPHRAVTARSRVRRCPFGAVSGVSTVSVMWRTGKMTATTWSHSGMIGHGTNTPEMKNS